MSRYYFNVRNSVVLDDPEGVDCSDQAAARNYALAQARVLAAEDVQEGRLDLKHRIEVADEDRTPLFVVTFRDAIAINF